MDPLLAISPLDGRYADRVKELKKFFSENALIEKRIFVENRYLEFIIPMVREDLGPVETINPKDGFAQRVKEIEKVTNHDVKAVEYYLQELYRKTHPEYIPYIHIGLTSADINSVARSLILKESTDFMITQLEKVELCLSDLIFECKDMPMLSRTHGQPATPTTMDTQMKVFLDRLKNSNVSFDCTTKFGGATGGFNAMLVAYPNLMDTWYDKLDEFILSLGLKRHHHATQVDHFDNYSQLFDELKRINTILIDLCQDIWLYISLGYFKLKINKNEVGSSTMPHKVNPIDFENAEGNLKMANSLFSFFSEKLPVSRLQRDLTDSTVTRNIGVAFGHTYLSYLSIVKGLRKLEPNKQVMEKELNENWTVLGEAVQTILRKNNYENGYEIVKNLTRTDQYFGKSEYLNLVQSLEINEKDKSILLNLTPEIYANPLSFKFTILIDHE